jgi:hypothetical protein
LTAPVLAHDVVPGPLRAVAHRREELVRGLAAVERRDQRLDDRGGAVVGARVAPGFEEMRFRDLPLAQRRRLIVVEAEVGP